MGDKKKRKPSDAAEKPGPPRLARGRTRPGAIFPVAPSAPSLPASYAATLQDIKTHLRSARVRAVLAANPIVIEAYCTRETSSLPASKRPPGAPRSLIVSLPIFRKPFPTWAACPRATSWP